MRGSTGGQQLSATSSTTLSTLNPKCSKRSAARRRGAETVETDDPTPPEPTKRCPQVPNCPPPRQPACPIGRRQHALSDKPRLARGIAGRARHRHDARRRIPSAAMPFGGDAGPGATSEPDRDQQHDLRILCVPQYIPAALDDAFDLLFAARLLVRQRSAGSGPGSSARRDARSQMRQAISGLDRRRTAARHLMFGISCRLARCSIG